MAAVAELSVIGEAAGSATAGMRVDGPRPGVIAVLDDLHAWGEGQAAFNSASR